MSVQRLGGTVVVMEKFDPEEALALIEKYKVDVGQFVPTHFVRMLKLPAGSPREVRRLVATLGRARRGPLPGSGQGADDGLVGSGHPRITTPAARATASATSARIDWLTHKGSVGKATTAELHIVGEDGEEVPPRTEGTVYFGGGAPLTYHNAPDKIAENTNKYGWTTLGDVGWVDEEGFLYLTDRKSFMIISGGVNIYPQELENLLITHPKVADAAVVGGPHEEMGEQVVAVIQPMEWASAGEELKAELAAFCRANLSHVKSPRVIDFMQELPRHPTGKLYKRLIRDAYWGKEGSKIV
jgi:long-chain acyl-CoA synthetase